MAAEEVEDTSLPKCAKCGKHKPEEEMNDTDLGEGNSFCDKCAAKYAQQCDGCGVIITLKPIIIDDYELCKECAEDWEPEEEDDWDGDEDDDDEDDE